MKNKGSYWLRSNSEEDFSYVILFNGEIEIASRKFEFIYSGICLKI